MDDSPIQTALCVIGHPIGGNPTQFVAQRALAALGLDWQFMSFDVAPTQIEKAIGGVDSLGFCGAMIASPYQTRVAKILTALREEPTDHASDKHAATTDQPAPDQPTHGQPTHGQPTHGQPTHGQPTHGQPTHGQPTLGQPTTWYDCLYRDDKNELLACNVYAEALKRIIDLHVAATGCGIQRCLLIGDEVTLANAVEPISLILPETCLAVVGAKWVPWPLGTPGPLGTPAVIQPPAAEPVTETRVAVANDPDEIGESPLLVLWTLHGKPSKKPVAKSSPNVPSPPFVTELLLRLHPNSLIIDLSGNTHVWLAPLKAQNAPPIVVVNNTEVEVNRLGIAIQRWTGHEPNIDSMREAIEEYLEI